MVVEMPLQPSALAVSKHEATWPGNKPPSNCSWLLFTLHVPAVASVTLVVSNAPTGKKPIAVICGFCKIGSSPHGCVTKSRTSTRFAEFTTILATPGKLKQPISGRILSSVTATVETVAVANCVQQDAARRAESVAVFNFFHRRAQC